MPRKFAAPVHPSAAIQVTYQAALRNELIKPMADDLLRALKAAWRDDPGIVGDAQPVTERAAGVMVRARGRTLFLHRTDGQGWAFPAGGVETGESPRDAAWRELAEETGRVAPLDEIKPYAVQQHGSLLFYTFVWDAPETFEPVLNGEHDQRAWLHVFPGLDFKAFHPGVRALLNAPTQDARPSTSRLRTVMERWGKKWTLRLETLAEKMAREFADASKAYTDRAVAKSFRDAGLTIRWRPTKRMIEGYAAVVYENVQLIKSIPQKFLGDVQSDVWISVTKGADAAALTEKIKHAYGVTWRRAALISRDQTAKAKAVFEASRREEIGIKRAKWLHSHAGREPRPTHVAMNGKLYDVTKGMWDKDEGEYVQPGELINCRCTSAAVIPGFDD